MRLSGFLRDGDQYRLDLFPGVPWDGVSPRGLTRVQIELSSRREPPGHEVEMDPAQLLFWPVPEKATSRKRPQQAAGAPSLLPLKVRPGWFGRTRRGPTFGE